jgi:cob(I)alamin adenosyltransferase
MTVRIDRVVTKGGDTGQTSLGDGSRVPKDAARVEA